MKRTKIQGYISAHIFLCLTVGMAGCQNRPGSTLTGGGDDGQFGPRSGQGSPFDGGFAGDLQNSLAGSGNTGGTVGSGTTGNLTEGDKQAITGMTRGLEEVNTEEGAFPQNLVDEATAILDAEAKAEGNAARMAQIQQMKVAMVSKILEQCLQKVGTLAPIPGQPLMGVWKGGGACQVDFQVTATGPQPVYRVSGKTEGRMVATAEGAGDVQGNPFKGTLSDNPSAGSGRLVHPTFHKTKSGSNPCEVAVTLQTPTNPIPENYTEAMKQLGKCHRQALLFMSPVMDKMFKNMPSNLSSILLKRSLGISK